jgi:D-3-phosphoglycerate dehydrogenase / 2-oxoglutarate reductase
LSIVHHTEKVIITGQAHSLLAQGLRAMGYQVVEAPTITRQELESQLSDIVGLVVTTRIAVDRPLLQKATALRWIGRLGSGMELIDTEYATEKGIRCISSPEGNRLSVAEHALGMLLSVLHRIHWSYQEIQQGKWKRNENRGIELSGQCVGIIGYGNTGSELARLLAPFGVTILANDIVKKKWEEGYIHEASLSEIAARCRVISFHVPLTTFTRNMANASFFDALQQSPVLINTSRGEVVDLEALVKALEAGKLSGAALDVLPNENLASYQPNENQLLQRLVQRPDVVLTPHIAGYSQESFERMSQVLLDQLRNVVHGNSAN